MRALLLGLVVALGAGCVGIPKGHDWDCFLVARAMWGSDQVVTMPAPKGSKTRCLAPEPPDAGPPLVKLRECRFDETFTYINCIPNVATPADWLREHKVTLPKPATPPAPVKPASDIRPPLS